MKRCAIFASGSGTNMENIANAFKDGTISGAEIVCVFSDKPEAYVLERAKHMAIPRLCISPKHFKSKKDFEQELLQHLKNLKIDFIILAGYMRIVGPAVLSAFEGTILNIHPALLPAFPGAHGIRDAFEAGVKETGVTVHIVDAGVDTGPIVLQEAIAIEEGESIESLTKRIHALEYALYPQAIQMMINDEIA